MEIINLVGVSKKYKHNSIFKNYSYSFHKGYCYLIIGSNGSGKTTLIKGILGLIKFTDGEVLLSDNKIGYVPEKIIYPDFISVYNFLYNLGAITSKNKNDLCKRLDFLLKDWQLEFAKNKLMSELSKGMMQKVLIIQSLLEDYSLYIFDEPLNGLDKNMQERFFNLIKTLKKQGKTIIISTHYPDYYFDSSDYVIKIENGSIGEKFNKVSF